MNFLREVIHWIKRKPGIAAIIYLADNYLPQTIIYHRDLTIITLNKTSGRLLLLLQRCADTKDQKSRHHRLSLQGLLRFLTLIIPHRHHHLRVPGAYVSADSNSSSPLQGRAYIEDDPSALAEWTFQTEIDVELTRKSDAYPRDNQFTRPPFTLSDWQRENWFQWESLTQRNSSQKDFLEQETLV